MSTLKDGALSPHFFPVPIQGNRKVDDLTPEAGITPSMAVAVKMAPRGDVAAWGIPFQIGDPLLVKEKPVSVPVTPFQARWLVFMHTADGFLIESGPGGLVHPDPRQPFSGEGRLNEHAADYVIVYADGQEARAQVRRRHQIGMYRHRWGELCFQAVVAHKPQPLRAHHEQPAPDWGNSQTRNRTHDWKNWISWLWAWQNPFPEKVITALRFEPVFTDPASSRAILISALSAGNAVDQPLRWRTRRKAVLKLPEDVPFKPELDEDGQLAQLQLDLGQVISAQPRPCYPNDDWANTYNNKLPAPTANEILVEYTSHPDACFHLWDGSILPVSRVEEANAGIPLQLVAPASRRVTLKVVEKSSGRLVASRLHIHSEAGEYLAPVDRHRIINPGFYEDYSVDFTHLQKHPSTYIPGETVTDLPLGRIYLEISKGFEIRPVRRVIKVAADTREIWIEIEKVLPWRERGWVTADTHVHFLSPGSAMLEGAAEGVNVVNLLASQWGDLMTNVGDFDGRTTWGAKETGGGPEDNGEYVVRVGTENRQHVLGHISLLGYRGRIIAPMTSGGPDESALGDPVDVLLTEWARQCRAQGGLVVLPHYPNPRAEHAASIVAGLIDAIEATSWENLYDGIDPYSLADWYRYLNCGYFVPIVGGTDKMCAMTAVGTLRTYAHLAPDQPFTYEAWMQAVQRGETFVTNGPLLDFSVEGKPAGARLALPKAGGTLDVTWQVATVTVPVTQIELVVNGETRASAPLESHGGSGSFPVKIEKSSWLALLVRGHYADQPAIITAHTSPVMVDVEGTQLLAAADALTILDQIEGALVYLDTIGTRAEDAAYKRMALEVQSAHRSLHNRLHRQGLFHQHSPASERIDPGHRH